MINQIESDKLTDRSARSNFIYIEHVVKNLSVRKLNFNEFSARLLFQNKNASEKWFVASKSISSFNSSHSFHFNVDCSWQ